MLLCLYTLLSTAVLHVELNILGEALQVPGKRPAP